jgi:hypothetical protein
MGGAAKLFMFFFNQNAFCFRAGESMGGAAKLARNGVNVQGINSRAIPLPIFGILKALLRLY